MSSVIANHLVVLVVQNRCTFLKMTEHNLCVNVYLDIVFALLTS